MVARSCTKDRALKASVHKEPDTDSARHCITMHDYCCFKQTYALSLQLGFSDTLSRLPRVPSGVFGNTLFYVIYVSHLRTTF